MRLLLIFIISINTCFAQDAVTLNKGDIAPFKGTLVKKERVEKLIKAEKKVIVLSDLRLAQEELIDYHKTDARRQREKLSKAKFDSNLKAVGYFVLGAVLTSLTFKINQKIGDI